MRWLSRNSATRSAVVGLLVTGCSYGQAVLPECFVEFAVYDPVGERLGPFQVISVELVEEGAFRGTELLESGPVGSRPVADQERLYFRREMIDAAPLVVRLEGQRWQYAYKRIRLTTCRQHESIFDGEIGYEIADILGFELYGRLSGCQFEGDWWVRSEPLFDGAYPYESRVDSSTGRFTIEARRGVRHLIVVGKGKHPIKAFAANYDGRRAGVDLGEFDVSRWCPEAVR